MDSANIQRGLNPPLNEVSFKCDGRPYSLCRQKVASPLFAAGVILCAQKLPKST
ncbi:MAG: hypothetical protein AB1815_00040 [Bacillota bacterium]